jgi:hypothetical protein
MIHDAAQFIYNPSPQVTRARRVLIKPDAGHMAPYPATTAVDTLRSIVDGIKRVSDADILILDGTPDGTPIYPIYKTLQYDFPHVLMLDVKDCIWVEVENPLLHPLAIPTFWVPNVVLSSDYLISVTPCKTVANNPQYSIANLLSLLPVAKYRADAPGNWKELEQLGIQKVLADLYFTLPFDLGIVDARQRLVTKDVTTPGKADDFGKFFTGEPYEVDREVAQMMGTEPEYLRLIDAGRAELEIH